MFEVSLRVSAQCLVAPAQLAATQAAQSDLWTVLGKLSKPSTVPNLWHGYAQTYIYIYVYIYAHIHYIRLVAEQPMHQHILPLYNH